MDEEKKDINENKGVNENREYLDENVFPDDGKENLKESVQELKTVKRSKSRKKNGLLTATVIGLIVVLIIFIFAAVVSYVGEQEFQQRYQQVYNESLENVNQGKNQEAIDQILNFMSDEKIEKDKTLITLKENIQKLQECKTKTSEQAEKIKDEKTRGTIKLDSLAEIIANEAYLYSETGVEAIKNQLIKLRDEGILLAAEAPNSVKGGSMCESLNDFYTLIKKARGAQEDKVNAFLNLTSFDEAKWNEVNGEAKEEGKALKEAADKKKAEEEAAKQAQKAQELENKKASAQAISYDELMRNPANYKNQFVVISGKILQVIDSGYGTKSYRIAMNGSYDQVALVSYSGSYPNGNILEDDYITFYGTYKGTTSYTSVLGASITVPSLSSSFYE